MFAGELNKGKRFSLKTIEAMRQAALNKDKVVFSKQAILNMKKNSKALIIKELSGIVYGRYSSITEAALALNCSSKTIQRCLKSDSKLLKRRWRVSHD